LENVIIEGIENVTSEMIQNAKKQNQTIKLIASISLKESKYILQVKPTAIANNEFLSQISGWEMACVLQTDIYGVISMKLYEREPIPTSASMMRDVFHCLTST